MKAILALTALALSLVPSFAAEDSRVFEMRTYYAPAGKLDALHARFREHTVRLFERHGITNIGYWTPIENPEHKLVYVLAYPSRQAADAAWKAFWADPEWKKAHAESEKDGKLVAKVEQVFLSATDYSPEIKPNTGERNRVFELRTYTTREGKLDDLHARFRDHTMQLFQKHGMTNLFYWKLLPEQSRKTGLAGTPDTTLIYLLAHRSVEAASASFDAFRKDPIWIAAKNESEAKAGGSLTVETDGRRSVFMQATDYSPTK